MKVPLSLADQSSEVRNEIQKEGIVDFKVVFFKDKSIISSKKDYSQIRCVREFAINY